MRRKYFKISVIFAMSFAVIMPRNAFAIHKLAFVAPIQDFLKKAEKVKENIETTVGNAMNVLNGKVLQVEGSFEGFIGTEGVALYRAYVPKGISGGVGNITSQAMSGNLDFSNWQDSLGVTGAVNGVNSDINEISGSIEDIKTQINNIGNIEQDIHTLEKLSNDYEEAMVKAKRTKIKKVDEELIKLYAIKNTNSLEGEDLEALAVDIALLEKEKLELSQTDLKEFTEEVEEDVSENTENTGILPENYKKKIDTLKSQLIDIQTNNQNSLFMLNYNNKVNETINNILPFGDNAETEDVYDEYIARLFIPNGKIANAENQQKVDKERRKEYYNAFQNLFKVMVDNQIMTMDINDKMDAMRGATTTADGIFGAKSMEVGVAIQLAKAAATYMDTQVASMRYQVTKDMQGWSNMYTLQSNDHNIAEFNLGDYDFETAKKKQKVRGATEDALSQAGNFFK